LAARITTVRRVLIVGWRGMDRHFAGMLADKLPRNVRIEIVAGSRAESDRVVENLKAAGIDAQFAPLDNSFSTYAINRVGRTFFNS
jgi:hypothetical protein